MADILTMLTQLRTEKANTEIRLNQLEEAIRNLERLSGGDGAAATIDPNNPRPFANVSLGDAAQALLTENGSLPTRELAELMLRGGVKTKARNFVATLYSLLHKDGRFVLVDRRWELKGKKGSGARAAR